MSLLARLGRAALIAVTLLALMPTTAFAYSLNGVQLQQQLWYHPTSKFFQQTKQDIRDGMASWNTMLPEYRRLCFDWSTHSQTNFPSSDGNCYIYKEYMSDSSILAENTYWYTTSNYYVYESDINLNSSQPWANGAYSGMYDVKTTVLHEDGHSLGLGHSGNSNAIMYPTIPSNTLKSIHSDDQAGLMAIYGTLSPNGNDDVLNELANRLGQDASRVETVMVSDPVYKMLTLQDLSDLSEAIATCTVTNRSNPILVYPSNGGNARYFTDFTVHVDELWFGDERLADAYIDIRLPYGIGGDIATVDSSAPVLQIGSTYVLFATKHYDGTGYNVSGDYFNLFGGGQGAWIVDGDSIVNYSSEEKLSQSDLYAFLSDYSESHDPYERISQHKSWEKEYEQNLISQVSVGFLDADAARNELRQLGIECTDINFWFEAREPVDRDGENLPLAPGAID